MSRSTSSLKNAGIILTILILFGLSFAFSEMGRHFFQQIYSPWLMAVIILMLVEYIVLKGRDRTRILQIERDHMKQKKEKDVRFFREVEEEISQLEKEARSIRHNAGSSLSEKADQELSQLEIRLRELKEQLTGWF